MDLKETKATRNARIHQFQDQKGTNERGPHDEIVRESIEI